MNQLRCLNVCSRFLAVILLPIVAMPCCQAELVLLGFSDFIWDRAADPQESPPIVIGIAGNSAVGSPNQLEAFNIGLRFVPIDSAMGGLEVSWVGEPQENAAFLFDQEPFVTYSDDLSLFDASHLFPSDVTITLPRSLFQMTLASPGANAFGRFEVFADPEFTQYFTTTAFDGFSFANAEVSGGYYLGTIEITAIPEPGSLAGLATAMLASLCVRTRRRVRSSSSAGQLGALR